MKILHLFLAGLTCICLAIYPTTCAAQNDEEEQEINKAVPLRDFSDVIRSIRGKNSDTATRLDTTYARPVLSIVPAVGYTLQTRLAAVLSGNVAFKTNSNARPSVISGNVTYTQNKQFYVPIQSNIWTKGNRYNLVGDYRFYKYPQSTFGLGSNSSVDDEVPMDYTFARFYQVVYKRIKGHVYGGLGYIIDYRWNISQKIIGIVPSDYEQYGPSASSISSGITLNGLYDTRDNIINPSKGFYTSLQVRNNMQVLGSTTNWRSVVVDARKYFRLKKSSPNILAFWSYNWFVVAGHPPYLDLPSNGWDTYNCTGRGYIQGRFRGAKMMYLESEYRFRISRNGLIGGVVFANAETFSAERGTTFQQIQPGYGTGIRVKLKKTSGTNIGIDYGVGTQGSKGLFINVGEYF